ncbi:hypothetical protein THIARS_40270 [Thiomonas delicata]|uniref:Uncharacterized protein n=1 Tax=Thiomonas delicata TaxID=364030 RepID=A0A238D072_THIDL|nr:hypothetical protein THIARS_40270 [Thiomonas delicata]
MLRPGRPQWLTPGSMRHMFKHMLWE